MKHAHGATQSKATTRCLAVLGLIGMAHAQVHQPMVMEPLGDQLGNSVARLGDVNADGVCDIIAGAIRPSQEQPGYAVLISGTDGSVLRTLHGSVVDDRFGLAVTGGYDVNGDSIPDCAVSAFHWRDKVENHTPGSVSVFSGASGEKLYQLTAPPDAEVFGRSLVMLSDVNGDGRGDLAVAAPALDLYGDGELGAVLVYSGTDGALLYRVNGMRRGDEFGRVISSMDDIDGDQVGDLLIGAPGRGEFKGLTIAGYVSVISGKTGTNIFTHQVCGRGLRFGAGIAAGLDLDGDGTGDFAVVSASDNAAATDGVRFFSGANRSQIGATLESSTTFRPQSIAFARLGASGSPTGVVMCDSRGTAPYVRIQRLDGLTLDASFELSFPQGGLPLCVLGDVDGDGADDFAIGCPWATPVDEPQGRHVGEVLLMSGASGDVLWRTRGGAAGH